MFEYLIEKMLKEYFTVDAIIGSFISDKAKLFECLGQIFLVPEADLDKLFPLVEQGEVKVIKSESDYHQHCRARQYFAMGGYERAVDNSVEALIDLKGAAIKEVKNLGLHPEFTALKSIACSLWTNAAESGNVLAMHTLGILLYEGIVFAKDAVRGAEYIKKAANWNNEEGLLASLCYDRTNQPKNLVRLREKLSLASHLDSYERVKLAYGATVEKLPKEFSLLEKAFNKGTLKRETYEKGYARILYSEIINAKDKESILFTPNKDLFSHAADLPLKLGMDKPDACNAEAIQSLLPLRASETKKVLTSLSNLDLRGRTGFRPLCLVSDSNYMLESYATAISEYLGDVHTERIEVADLTEYELEPSKSNVFVHGCDEDEFNAYFMFFRGNIHEKVFDIAKSFLQGAKRTKFKLYRPDITLNLGAILPVCFCDRENAHLLRPYCDIVDIANTTVEEKSKIVRDILSEKGKEYGVDVAIEDSVCDKILSCSEDEIESILDKAIREHRAQSLNLTVDIMQPYFNGRYSNKGAYGFGGSIHE